MSYFSLISFSVTMSKCCNLRDAKYFIAPDGAIQII